MSMAKTVRNLLSRFPVADAWFRRLVWSRIHFPEEELRFIDALPSGSVDVAIDVGGALGSYAWPLNRKARRVIVFEPGRVHSSFLACAVAFSRIELVRSAVGEKPGRLKLYTPGDDVTARHSATLSQDNPAIDVATAKTTEVDVVTLDDYADAHLRPGEKVDILKVDIEGFELAVFRGASRVIQRDHPLIFCEIEARHNPNYRQVFETLEELGYAAYYAHGGKMERLLTSNIEGLQTTEALTYRLSESYKPGTSRYINNFTFEHPRSRIKVTS